MRFRIPVTIMAMSLVVVSVACSGGKNDKERATSKKPTISTVPPECSGQLKGEGVAGAGQEVNAACANQIFLATTESAGSKELKAKSEETRLAFGHGVCAYAQVIGKDSAAHTSYEDFVKETSTSWGVSRSVVEEVVTMAERLCPNQLEPLRKMKNARGPATVRLSAVGPVPLRVRYTGPEGNELEDTINASPWEHDLDLIAPSDTHFSVRSDKGGVRCAVSVNGKKIRSAKAEKGHEADCSVTAAEVGEATS